MTSKNRKNNQHQPTPTNTNQHQPTPTATNSITTTKQYLEQNAI